MVGEDRDNARDKEMEDEWFPCIPRKINTRVWQAREREGEKYDKETHSEGNERPKTFKMRRDLVTLNDTRRGSQLSSGY